MAQAISAEPTPDDDRLAAALAEWLELAQNFDNAPDPEPFLARHPDLEAALRPRLAQWHAFHAQARPFPALFAATDRSPAAQASAEVVLPRPAVRLGDFELLDEIGRGGMGVVYRARQLSLGRVVALKVLRREDASPTDALRLHNEALLAAQLEHPHIVPVYHVGEQGACPISA